MRWIWLAAFVAACGGSSPGGDDDVVGDDDGGGDDDSTGNASVFDSSVTDVVVEIDYEDGEEPYTGQILGFGDTFDLTVANVDRLFAGTKALTIPRTLAEMEAIGAVDDEELTVQDLVAIAGDHRGLADSTSTKTYYVVFLSGHFADGDGVQSGVLGVSLGNTGIVAMFKDVIESTGLPAVPNLERYVEQSTLVHELAHAIGLVGNGVAAIAPHRDDPHGSHCTNDQCVMYWLNEGASGMAEFASDFVVSGDAILFDADCLADVDALTGGP
jgi:hypothetical protein